MYSVCLVGSSGDGLRLRLRLSLVLGRTRPSWAEPSPLALASSVGTSALGEAFINIVHKQGRRPCHQVVAMGVANIITRLVSLAAPGYGEGPVRYSDYAPTTAASQWRLRQRSLARWRRRRGDGRSFRRRRSSVPSVSSFAARIFHSQYTT